MACIQHSNTIVCVSRRLPNRSPVVLDPLEMPRTMTRPEYLLRHRMQRIMGQDTPEASHMDWMGAFGDWCDCQEEGMRRGFWGAVSWGLGFGTSRSEYLLGLWDEMVSGWIPRPREEKAREQG